ncbi:MAG: GNAT family N-acetyltransferase, partial [Candidatus Eremiobacteraeota bacterium]|nr:GNAT family N-acetyltransferase [Candidatus Eremiobacteraeota bacterium]
RELMTETLDEASRGKYRAVQLWVHCNNARAVRLYERFGFVDTNAERLDEFGEPMHRYTLALPRVKSRIQWSG